MDADLQQEEQNSRLSALICGDNCLFFAYALVEAAFTLGFHLGNGWREVVAKSTIRSRRRSRRCSRPFKTIARESQSPSYHCGGMDSAMFHRSFSSSCSIRESQRSNASQPRTAWY